MLTISSIVISTVLTRTMIALVRLQKTHYAHIEYSSADTSIWDKNFFYRLETSLDVKSRARNACPSVSTFKEELYAFFTRQRFRQSPIVSFFLSSLSFSLLSRQL